jgi:hypothetical protein
VFTARYALSPYIKQIRFVFKGLICKVLDSRKNPSFSGIYIIDEEGVIFLPNSEKRLPIDVTLFPEKWISHPYGCGNLKITRSLRWTLLQGSF